MVGKIIYIVDGDASARKGLTRYFTIAGNDVKALSSIEEFFLIQINDDNSCLIIDVDSSGKDLQAALDKNNICIPIIFLSARDDQESRDKTRIAQAAGFFRKPIDGPALLDAVAWVLDGQERKSC